jgi:hypothetical protein
MRVSKKFHCGAAHRFTHAIKIQQGCGAQLYRMLITPARGNKQKLKKIYFEFFFTNLSKGTAHYVWENF